MASVPPGEPARDGALEGLAAVALVVELPQGESAPGRETLERRLGSRLRELPEAPRLDPASRDRLLLRVAASRVSSSDLRGFWLPFSGDYLVGVVRLAVEREARLVDGDTPLPVLVWWDEQPVASSRRGAPDAILAAVDRLADSFLAACCAD